MRSAALLPLPTKALGVLALLTPLVALLFDPDPQELTTTVAASLRSIAACWLFSLTVAVALHAAFGGLPGSVAKFSRYLGVRMAGASLLITGVALAVTFGLLPLWQGLDPRLTADPLALALRCVLVAHSYVAACWLAVVWQRRTDEARRQTKLAEIAAFAAQVQAVQARTDPHFLFNSLNAVLDLMVRDNNAAEDMLVRLSAIFRHVLDASAKREIELATDMICVKDYLAVQALRFEPRLHVQVHMPPDLAQCRVPPLLLLPLVENAVVHGVAASEGIVHVQVDVRREGEQLVLSVQDDAVVSPSSLSDANKGSKTALRDLETRLKLVFGQAAQVEAHPTSPGFIAQVRLPIGPAGRRGPP